MKKLLLCALALFCTASYAQKEVTIKAGTAIPLHAVEYTRASRVKVGDPVLFRVGQDVNINGVTAIPFNTTVKGFVYYRERSSWWGTKGKLGIRITDIFTLDGNHIPLEPTDIYITGVNRTALSVVLFCFVTIPGCCIAGSRAEMHPGYEVIAHVAKDTVVKVQ